MFVVVTGGSGSGKSAYAEGRAVALGSRRMYIATMECFDQESRERVKRHRAMRAGKGFSTVERYLSLSSLRLPNDDNRLARSSLRLPDDGIELRDDKRSEKSFLTLPGDDNEAEDGEHPEKLSRPCAAGSGQTYRDHETGKCQEAQDRVALLECMSNLAANEMFDPKGSGEHAYEEICAGIENLLRQCEHLVAVTNEIFSDAEEYDPSTEAYRALLGKINCYMAERADEVVEVVYGIPLTVKGQNNT